MRISTFISGIMVCIPVFVRASVISGPVVNPANGHRYYLLSTNLWTASEQEALTLGGHLATVRSHAENDFIFNTFSGSVSASSNLWTGLYDPVAGDGNGASHATNFRWISGEPVNYTNWGVGEPTNSAAFGGEYYGDITINAGGALVPRVWNDASNTGSSTSIFGVVEVLPEPTCAAFLCLAGIAMIRRRGVSITT